MLCAPPSTRSCRAFPRVRVWVNAASVGRVGQGVQQAEFCGVRTEDCPGVQPHQRAGLRRVSVASDPGAEGPGVQLCRVGRRPGCVLRNPAGQRLETRREQRIIGQDVRRERWDQAPVKQPVPQQVREILPSVVGGKDLQPQFPQQRHHVRLVRPDPLSADIHAHARDREPQGVGTRARASSTRTRRPA